MIKYCFGIVDRKNAAWHRCRRSLDWLLEVVKAKLHIVVYIQKKIHRVKREFIKKASLLIVKRGKEHSCKNLDQESNLDVLVEKKLNAFCVTWSASYDGNELFNTCSIDNFITLISLHSESILSPCCYRRETRLVSSVNTALNLASELICYMNNL